MWNFTVRGAIIPNCNGIQHLLNDPEMSQEPQRQLSLLKAEDLFIGVYSHNLLFGNFITSYCRKCRGIN